MKILNDTFANIDLIGHDVYSKGLVNVIESIEANGSFTIGVYGEWGSGKTSLLKQIQKTIDDKNVTSEKKTLTVWFNPWQFVSEEHLIIPFFHTIISTLNRKKDDNKFEKIKNNIEKFLLKVSNIPMALLYGMELEFKIPYLLNSKFDVSKFVDYQEDIEKRIDDNHNKSEITELSKQYDSVYYNLINVLKEAIHTLDQRIVIFIDDLDRTLPEKAIQLLEGIKVLFDLPNVIFVIGADKQVIQSGIKLRYKDIYDNKEMLENIENKYLHKIIQFPFSLPSADPNKLKENIIKNNLSFIPDAHKYVDLIYNTLGNNPRDIKRFINTISFYHYIALQRFSSDKYNPILLIKISLIQYLYEKLFRQLEQNPNDLIRLEKVLTQLKIKNPNSEIQLLAQSVKPTGIVKIDKWLDVKTFSKLFSILAFGDSSNIRFNDAVSANKYIKLTAPSKTNTIIKVTNDEKLLNEITLFEEIKNRLVYIPSDTSNINEEDNQNLIISNNFYVDKYPITQSLFYKVMGYNPSYNKGEDNPVEYVTWYEAVDFCNKLSRKCGFEEVYSKNENKNIIINYDKNGFRLLNENEWDYISRNVNLDNIDKYAFFLNNSNKKTHEVGLLEADEFGIFDMFGNVWEWCNDNYQPEFNPNKVYLNEDSLFRVIRGGSWTTSMNRFKNGVRYKEATNTKKTHIGFRICIQNINI